MAHEIDGNYTEMKDITEHMLEKSDWSDYHANRTISFGELDDMGFDWGQNSYYPKWGVDNPHRVRINEKIKLRYWFREISETPPGKWKIMFYSKLNESIPKYALMLELLDNVDLIYTSMTEEKKRTVNSDYPENMVNGENDYLTDGEDMEHILNKKEDVLKRIQLLEQIDNIDSQLLDCLDVCFCSIISSNTYH